MTESTESAEKTKPAPQKSASAGFRKLVLLLVILFFVWIILGQVIPRIFLPVNTSSLRQELTITPTDNQPLKRQSFAETLEAKEREIAEMRSRMELLENRLKALEEHSGQPAEVDMAAIQASVKESQQQTNSKLQEEQHQSIAKLQEEHQQTTSKLQNAINEMQAEYNQKLASATEKLATLQTKQEELAARPTESEQNRVRMAAIENMIKQQNTLIETMKTEVASAQLQTVRQLSALASFVPMKEAILRGEPFDIPLAQMLNFTNGNRKVESLAGQLRPIAKEGVPSLPVLKTEFDGLLGKALAASGGNGSFSNNLRSLITIRKTGEQAGASDEAILARAEKRMAQDDLDAALKELAGLSSGARTVMDGWMEKAKRYVLIRGIINEMQLALTQDVNAVQTSMPARDIAPAPAPAETPAPAAAPAPEAAKPAVPATAEKSKEKTAKPAAAKPAPAAKPAAKEKPASKPAAKPVDTEEQEDSNMAHEPAAVVKAPEPASAPEPKTSYPGN